MFAQMIAVENAARLALADLEAPRAPSRPLDGSSWLSVAAVIAGLSAACAGFAFLF